MGGRAEVCRVGTRLVFVGTIHVDPASASRVARVVHELRPEVVGLELDQERLDALRNPRSARPNLSGGLSFLAIALLEKFAGQLAGSSPGQEMLEAVHAANSIGARVELIDRPIGATIAGLKKLPLGEKMRIGVDGVASLAFLPFGKGDFSTLTEGLDTQLRVFRTRYPNLSKLLLDDRERFMANKIKKILDETLGQVVAVVGLGHLGSLAKAVEGYREDPAYSTTMTWTIGGS